MHSVGLQTGRRYSMRSITPIAHPKNFLDCPTPQPVLASPPPSARKDRYAAPAAEPTPITSRKTSLTNPDLPSTPNSQRIQVGVRLRPLPAPKPQHPSRQANKSRTPLQSPSSRIDPISRAPSSRSISVSSTSTSKQSTLSSLLEPCVTVSPARLDCVGITDPSGRKANREFNFDAVFAEEDTTEEVYKRMVKGVVDKCLEGYNGCVFAYGQTASGKTYTMEGYKPAVLHPPPTDEDNRGIILRVAADIVSHIQETTAAEAASDSDDVTLFSVKASYLEIYQETLTDLLCEKEAQGDLRIRMDPDSLSGRELYVQGLTEREVVDLEDYVHVVQTGSKRRTVGETNMNDLSSRSHAVLTLTIEQVQRRRNSQDPSDINSRKRSKIHLVDLAGSERANTTLATGLRLKEGSSINQSLLTLGNVISALSTPGTHHISYRDSKLTYLLSDSLGGNALTVVIACISPAPTCYEETLGTLRFAERAKKVVCRARVNVDMQSMRIQTLESEIAHLRHLLVLSQQQLAIANKPKCADASTSTVSPTETKDAETSPTKRKRGITATLMELGRSCYKILKGKSRVRVGVEGLPA